MYRPSSFFGWKFGFETLEHLKSFLQKSFNRTATIYSILRALPYYFEDGFYVCCLPQFRVLHIDGRREPSRKDADTDGELICWRGRLFGNKQVDIDIIHYMLGFINQRYDMISIPHKLYFFHTQITKEVLVGSYDLSFAFLTHLHISTFYIVISGEEDDYTFMVPQQWDVNWVNKYLLGLNYKRDRDDVKEC